jgi:hypothetical protein
VLNHVLHPICQQSSLIDEDSSPRIPLFYLLGFLTPQYQIQYNFVVAARDVFIAATCATMAGYLRTCATCDPHS